MATIFPLSASVGQQFQDYAFDGESWNIIGENWKPFTYSATEPDYHEPGFIWVDSNEVIEEITYATASGYQILTNKVMDGDNNYFSNIPESATLPDQDGNAGKYLTTSGSVSSWGTLDLESAINTASAAAVTYLVDSAPETLNTLNELSAALNDDANFATTVTNSLSNKLDISSASSTYLTQANASSTYANMATTPISGFRNAIINGDFRVWQRGASFTPAAGAGSYTADRWAITFAGGTPTNSVARTAFTSGIATSLGVEAEYFYKSTITNIGTATRYSVQQRIEDVRTFAGQTVVSSFWAKADSSRTLRVYLLQNFGTGGSAQVAAGFSDFNLTTSWQKFTFSITVPSISGKTIGTNSNLTIRFDQATASGSVLDLWGVQVEQGSIATPFEQRPIGTELALCQRYYYKSPYIVSPYILFNTGNVMSGTYQFPVTMRVAPPSITYYDGANTVNKITIANAGGTAQNNITPPSTLNRLTSGWNFGAGGMGGTTGNNGNIILSSYEANAEL
jgi:hypothetical protein